MSAVILYKRLRNHIKFLRRYAGSDEFRYLGMCFAKYLGTNFYQVDFFIAPEINHFVLLILTTHPVIWRLPFRSRGPVPDLISSALRTGASTDNFQLAEVYLTPHPP